jgi:hypothetical protein
MRSSWAKAMSRCGSAEICVFGLRTIAAAFLVVLPWIGLDWSESALKKCVIDHIAFPVFATNDPIAALYIAEAKISGDSLGFRTLSGVDKQRSSGSKCAHDSSAGGNRYRQILFNRCVHKG